VDGISCEYPEKIRRRIGVLPEGLGFPKQMTGIEYLTFFGQLYGRTAAEAKAKGLVLLEEVGMQKRGNSLVGTYSHGMRQRLGIARALVNDPAVVFLDEPTLGLDPRGQQELLSLVQSIARERHAGVILCSHMLTEVESVCDDVVILSSGQVVASGSASDVIGKAGQNVVRIRVSPPSVRAAQQILEGTANVLKVTPTGEMTGWLRADLAAPAGAASSENHHVNNRILEALIRAGIPVLSFEGEGGRLQDVFLNLTAEAIK
jgi:ABC-2 type transport system ATP-binding protein